MESEVNELDSVHTSTNSSTASTIEPFFASDGREEPTFHAEFDDVRVLPPKMIFQDAYDGKVFNQSFSIINCGKYPAFVRIMSPGSTAFKCKSLQRGRLLSAGLSIKRKMSYTHTSATALPRSSVLIYINQKPIIYQIEVHLISPSIKLNPNTLDFGEIDVGTASEQKFVQLCNQGQKVAQFSVDIGRSDLEVIVEPMKGAIKPSEIINVTVEVLGSKLGRFDKEFWIKMNNPQRVKLTGTFIPPKLVVEHPMTTFRFILVDFPRTYLGAQINKTLVLRNHSSSATMFCVLCECPPGIEFLDKARETNEDLRSFKITPKEGRLGVQQNYVLHLSFIPKKMQDIAQNYSIVFLRIMKVNYRDGVVVEKDVEVKTFPADSDLYSASSLTDMQDSREDARKDDETEDAVDVRLCLYGEMEKASVKLTPESYSMTYLKTNQRYIYELNIKNMSSDLPITVQYRKVPCIDIEPKKIVLRPNARTEVIVAIRPSIIGEVNQSITFDLIHKQCKVGTACLSIHYIATIVPPVLEPKFNLGITPKITNEVGFLVDDVKFNSNVKKPLQAIVDKNYKRFNKNNNDLIAFPNDRPKSLRPWKNKTPCRTIFSNLPRLVNEQDDYTLNEAERDVKNYTKKFYTNYVRGTAKETQSKILSPDVLPSYDVTDEKLLLMEGMYYSDCRRKITRDKNFYSTGLPLPPEKLMKVNIRPKSVDLGKLAPYTMCTESFSIQNDNDFAIIVSIKALSNFVVIKSKKTMQIESGATKSIFFDCWSHDLGKYYVPVFLIVNGCHIFSATVFATIVPTTVVFPGDEIIIDPKYNKTFFEIFNPVNCDISFTWEVQDGNFEVYPSRGIVPFRRSLYCRILFIHQEDAVYKSEIYLISQSGAKQIIRVICDNEKASVGFDTSSIKFNNIPLNLPVTRELVLRNSSDMQVIYFVKPLPVSDVSVVPSKGRVHPKSEVLLEVTAHFKSVVVFSFKVEFIMQNKYAQYIDIEGNVLYPNILIEPEFLQIPKIASGGYQRRVFRIKNDSESQNVVNFRFKDFPEFFITDTEANVIVDGVSLKPYQSKDLFLEFKPLEPIAYSMFLPFALNGIIGPPVLNDRRSIDPSSYLVATSALYSSMAFPVTAVSIPEAIPLVRIRCAAVAPCLKFSSLNLNFFKRRRHFSARNCSSTGHRLTVPMSDSEQLFHLSVEKGKGYKTNERRCDVYLKPGEDIVFAIDFIPTEFGVYNVKLPIFVNKSIDPCPFNYLSLSASHTRPVIICSRRTLYYQTIPVREKTSEKIGLTLKYHQEDCTVNAVANDETLLVKLAPKVFEHQHRSQINATVIFNPIKDCFVESEIIFNCSCSASYTLPVRASADDSFFPTYENFIKGKAFRLSKKFKSTFPYFPKSTDDSFYAERMRFVRRDMEQWVYAQGFFYKNYFKIPDGMSRFPAEIQTRPEKSKSLTSSSSQVLPLVQLLINLLGSGVVKCFDNGTLTPACEGIEGAIYMYATYRNILNFLKSRKVYVVQAEPEYLMPFNLYAIFMEQYSDETRNQQQSTEEKIMSEEDFYHFSTQCWIDLLMRIYKTFIFNRTFSKVPKSKSKSGSPEDVYYKEFKKYFSEHKTDIPDTHENEVKLLLWLEFHFEKQKAVLWGSQNSEHLQKPRKIRAFEIDLSDGLAMATLLYSYCPYIGDDLKNFITNYKREDQMFHNKCLIYESMNKLNFSWRPPPPHLMKPSKTELVITVVYLYNVLPGFYPKQTITFEAPLGEEAVNEIMLKNTDNLVIAFTPIFFSNDTNDFQVDSGCLIIPPKKQKTLKITYKAKSVLKKSCVLLLSGETTGFKYAKSMAINLIGYPKIFNPTDEFNFKAEVYELRDYTIDICSPFEMEYDAKSYFYFGDVQKTPESNDEFVSVSSFVSRSVPREVCIDEECTFDSEGFATVNLKLCFVSCGNFSCFIFFLNADVGDFCIKMNIASNVNKKRFIDLEIVPQVYFSTTEGCTCSGNLQGEVAECTCLQLKYECTKLIVVQIPYRNDRFIEGLRLMLRTCAEESEFEFWNSLLDYPKGLHIFRKYVSHTFEEELIPFRNVLRPRVTYKVEFDKTNVNYPQYITFDNITSAGSFMFPMHWNRGDEPKEEILKLYADNGQEVRQYRLTFVPSNINNM